ncbi:E3 ubiquitin-protein ligase RNF14-like [Nematostella vectensis]|uniref:E3 ubiquitin-protein ligase RNF14-like n=1 Tax=Nematostella vectensis TaxID=45351 RepID=UPI002077796C|nr:E3 ubiquitin-protein ligase RNF14-like [Nematostella vectensis]
MAACMDDELDNARLEQRDEVTVLESIFEDSLIQGANPDEGEELAEVSFSLLVRVHAPVDNVLVEAVIPVQVDEYVANSPNQDSIQGDKNKGDANVAVGGSEEQDGFNKGDPGQVGEEISPEGGDVQQIGVIHASIEKPAEEEGLFPGREKSDGGQHFIGEPEGSSVAAAVQGIKPKLTRLLSTKHWHIQSEVQELTPINLWCKFPPLYPSKDMPQFSLSCLWLTSLQLQELAKQLVRIWEENTNMPIVFLWADWLSNEAWEFLYLDQHLILREDEGEKERIETPYFAIAAKIPLEMALLEIFENDLKFKREQFLRSRHSCDICIEELDADSFCLLDECGHYCCVECMRYHCEMHVKNGTVMQLLCPIHKCEVPISPYTLQEVLPEDLYTRYERLMLSKTLDLMGDIYYCPRCHSAVVADEEESSHLAHCAVCFYAFCTECQAAWHHGKSCDDEELPKTDQKKEKVKNRKKKKLTDDSEDSDYGQAGNGRYMSSRAFILAMKRCGTYRSCPACKVVVEKTTGCDMMTCSQCRANFCWRCGNRISSYSHFSECNTSPPILRRMPPRGPSKGEQIEAEFKKNNPGAQLHYKNCGRCKQKNLKQQKNNFMRCWACKTQFCYQCGKTIENGIKHFVAPSPCSQHSDD